MPRLYKYYIKRVVFINQVVLNASETRECSTWFSAAEINLSGAVATEWDSFIEGITHAGITLTVEMDHFYWAFGNGDGSITTPLAYAAIVSTSSTVEASWWSICLSNDKNQVIHLVDS